MISKRNVGTIKRRTFRQVIVTVRANSRVSMAWTRSTRDRLAEQEWDEHGGGEGAGMTGSMMALSVTARISSFILKYRGIRGFQAIVVFYIF